MCVSQMSVQMELFIASCPPEEQRGSASYWKKLRPSSLPRYITVHREVIECVC